MGTIDGKRWKRWLRRLAGTVVVLVALAVLAVAGGAWWLRHAMRDSLPQLDGQLRAPGLSAGVTVERDGHGIPHIRAASLDDLLIAQGYVTAQDRLWQMDMARRAAAGELAEILGSSLVDHDRAQRVLEMRPTAERMAAGLSERDRRLYEDYARGVNAYIETHQDHLPAEFRLLGYRPRQWQTADSLVIGLSMVQLLDQRFDEKLSRERITARLGPTMAADLYPTGSWRDHPPLAAEPDLTAPQENIPDVPLDESQSSLRDLLQLREALGRRLCEGCARGSNEWAVSGAHTASGRPLLSNDMHLDLGVPNIWYEIGLEAPGLHAAGVSIPGAPLVVEGHNEHVAWGFTALFGDTQDLYVEQTNAQGEYLSATGWKPMERGQETIHVRMGRDVIVKTEATEHGAVITPLLRHEQRIIALRWNAYDPKLGGFPLYEINTASNWIEFRAAMSHWWGPTQNVIYADDQGHIGYQAVGAFPSRPGGLAALPILDRQHEWQGYLPFEALPSVFDPASGVLATANARITPDGYPYPLTLGWEDPYRNERIWKWLSGKNHLTPADMLTLQTDIYSEVNQELAQRFAYAIDHTPGASAQLRQAADLMRTWNGLMATDSPAAAIVSAAKSAFWPLVLQPRLGDDWKLYEWPSSLFAEEELIIHGPAQWLPSGYANWDALLTAVIDQGLRNRHAPADLKTWSYGATHVVQVDHPLYAMLPWLDRWTGSGRWPQSGDKSTVKATGLAFGPSQRLTVDWSAPDEVRENIVMGESGNPLSPYYHDQWSYWYGGRTFAFPFSDKAATAAAAHTLRLVP